MTVMKQPANDHGAAETTNSRAELRDMLISEMSVKPFSELFGVTFNQRGSEIVGDVLLDAVESNGYSLDDFDAVGALTAAAVPLVLSMLGAASRRGAELNGFVMDFVYPSIKGTSIKGKRVLLLDSWLSEKSYVQTSSLVTLRNGNELSLDFGVVEHEGAKVVAIASLIGGVDNAEAIEVINPVTQERRELPFIQAYHESELRMCDKTEEGEANA